MSFSVATRRVFLPSLSPAAAGALPLGPSTSETRQKHSPRRSLKRGVGLFRKEVWGYWKKNGRHDLPWRSPSLKLRRTKEILDPYKILVSEIMLQQTQVSRVSEKYREFLEAFPTVRVLARASLLDVLKVWSGLGYNRRAKFLHDTAKRLVLFPSYRTKIAPWSYEDLRKLPGIGDYTAKAVRVFAFNEPEVLIETNVRTVFIHHFFPRSRKVPDAKLLPLVEKSLKGQDARTFYAALMDYGTYLKSQHLNPSRRSKHYTKQSKFEGSLRQVRGAILKAHTRGEDITGLRNPYMGKFDRALDSLIRDGLVVR